MCLASPWTTASVTLTSGCSDVPDFSAYLRAQPAAMDERRHDAVAREAVQVLARLAEPRAAQPHLADAEHAVHQVVERYTARRHVATCLGRRDLDAEVAERVDRLGLDQRDLASALRRLGRVMTAAGGIAITLEAVPGQRARLRHHDHRRARLPRHMDRHDAALPRLVRGTHASDCTRWWSHWCDARAGGGDAPGRRKRQAPRAGVAPGRSDTAEGDEASPSRARSAASARCCRRTCTPSASPRLP